MPKRWSASLAAVSVFALLFSPLSALAAVQRLPVQEDQKVQILDFKDRGLLDLGTDGLSAIYWIDEESHNLVIYDINENTLSATPGADIFDLHVYGRRLVYRTLSAPLGFTYRNGVANQTQTIETDRKVDSIRCFDGSHVGYLSNDSEFWVYDLAEHKQTLVSDKANGNFFFCSLSGNYISFNDQRDGNSRVYLHLIEQKEDFLVSSTAAEGRRSVVVDDTVYFDELGFLYSYDIAARKTTALFSGMDITGYASLAGADVLAFSATDENGLRHPYLYLPDYDMVYRLGDIDRHSGTFAISNGLITWIEYRDGQQGLFASSLTAIDTDLDGVPDFSEFTAFLTNPFLADTDGDGFDDGVEIDHGYSPLVPSQADTKRAPAQPAPAPTPTVPSASIDPAFTKQVAGKILLQVEQLGEAWYVDPVTLKRYYMKDGIAAFAMMRSFGLGISNADLGKIPPAGSSTTGDKELVNRLRGRIVLQVESKGEAWYINPADGKRYFLRDGEAAYELMRTLSVGITNANLDKVPVGSI
ncbi:MAG: hypothetical protein HY461_03090 [Parcubacteria group bacterium]|nr:hypothetical protein [Parcubacteria group bacterium]